MNDDKRLASLQRLYRWLAPIYSPLRPIWANTLSVSAEKYLDKVVLPGIIRINCNLLDLGCGPASNLLRLKRLKISSLRYVGLDLSNEMIASRPRYADHHAMYVQSKSTLLPFRSQSFDVVLSTWMFSHLKTPDLAIREGMRVLRPGGWMVIICFARSQSWAGAFLKSIEPFFLMRSLPLEKIRTWPDLVDIKTFAGGCNAAIRIQKPEEMSPHPVS